ncbi:hypothetical protein Ctob_009470 [Chrysochromulina tobinii]|uniref:Uncharacterized protein n=1 Tax=Chrysochromulina tobinii TaxID=1460289 RepID=A0A0M0K1E2_9EUKA|nr:hypothetical protein Ctob_009470 [Chrysochromulina tobinii]|eukprot:KOO32208.1 hypothetical protein Ctob_009470 [Chrysochromulina sp. CCMP291]
MASSSSCCAAPSSPIGLSSTSFQSFNLSKMAAQAQSSCGLYRFAIGSCRHSSGERRRHRGHLGRCADVGLGVRLEDALEQVGEPGALGVHLLGLELGEAPAGNFAHLIGKAGQLAVDDVGGLDLAAHDVRREHLRREPRFEDAAVAIGLVLAVASHLVHLIEREVKAEGELAHQACGDARDLGRVELEPPGLGHRHLDGHRGRLPVLGLRLLIPLLVQLLRVVDDEGGVTGRDAHALDADSGGEPHHSRMVSVVCELLAVELHELAHRYGLGLDQLDVLRGGVVGGLGLDGVIVVIAHHVGGGGRVLLEGMRLHLGGAAFVA